MADTQQCQSCRFCCRFETSEAHYAPLFTGEEVERVRSTGLGLDVFNPHGCSANLSQVALQASAVASETMLVCPFLDEATHRCRIYEIRPFDCRIWPFILMLDEGRDRILVAHFAKDLCPITRDMGQEDFARHLRGHPENGTAPEQLAEFVRRYPGFPAEYEAEAFVVSELTVRLPRRHLSSTPSLK